MRSFQRCPRGLDLLLRRLQIRGYDDYEVNVFPTGAAVVTIPPKYIIVIQANGSVVIYDTRQILAGASGDTPDDVLDLPDISIPLFMWDPPEQEGAVS